MRRVFSKLGDSSADRVGEVEEVEEVEKVQEVEKVEKVAKLAKVVVMAESAEARENGVPSLEREQPGCEHYDRNCLLKVTTLKGAY